MTETRTFAASRGRSSGKTKQMFTKSASKIAWPTALRGLFLTCAASAMLVGCGIDQTPTAMINDDYHQLHPVVLAEGPTTLDVFPVHYGEIDAQSIEDIKAFAQRYASRGRGRIVILAPANGGWGNRNAVNAIRRVLASTGLRGSVGVGSYPVGNRTLAAPIRLSFIGLKAEEISRCGEWPTDLAGGGTTDAWKNQNYFNYGCATQATLSAQVDDPRDLAGPRALGPSDVETRLRAIGAVRQGQDPGTHWEVKNTDILQVGGGN
jgi:pilus assembly protein CpaD